MDPQRWAVIESLYHAALEKEPGERSSYLAAACAEDPTLRNEVESLLGYADAHLSEPAERSELAKILGEIVGIPAIDRMEVSQRGRRHYPRANQYRPVSNSPGARRRRHGNGV